MPTDRLFENKTITGHYVAPVPVLASAGADPVYLVAAVSGALLLTAVLTVFLLRRRRKRSASSAPGPSEENDRPPSA